MPAMAMTPLFAKRSRSGGLRYVMGVKSTTTLWAPGTEPLPPQPKSRTGRPPKLLRRGPGHQPVNAQELAPNLPRLGWRSVSWREGTHSALSSRFAARRIATIGGRVCAKKNGC